MKEKIHQYMQNHYCFVACLPAKSSWRVTPNDQTSVDFDARHRVNRSSGAMYTMVPKT